MRSSETQTFGAAAFEETRTRAGVSVRNWIGQRTRVAGGAANRALDRSRTIRVVHRRHGVLAARRSARARGSARRPGAAAATPFATAAATARFRSKTSATGNGVAVRRRLPRRAPRRRRPPPGPAPTPGTRATSCCARTRCSTTASLPAVCSGAACRRPAPRCSTGSAAHAPVPLRARGVRRLRPRDARTAGERRSRMHVDAGARPAVVAARDGRVDGSTPRTACATAGTRCRSAGSGERG